MSVGAEPDGSAPHGASDGPGKNRPADGLAPDELLVEQSLRGDGAAFGDLVRRYQRQAVAVSYRLLGRADDAADVVQDAFVRAHRGLASLEQRARFGPWLMRIVSNLSLNYRRLRRHSAAALDDIVEEPGGLRRADGEAFVASVAPEGGLVSTELRDAIGRAVNALPDKQRLALVLSSVEGMPQKDVAEVLGCSVELVKWNVFQARKTLRKQLEGYL